MVDSLSRLTVDLNRIIHKSRISIWVYSTMGPRATKEEEEDEEKHTTHRLDEETTSLYFSTLRRISRQDNNAPSLIY